MFMNVCTFFFLTVFAITVDGNLFGSSAATAKSSFGISGAVNIKFGHNNRGGYGGSLGESDEEFRPGKPSANDPSAFLMDQFYIPLSLGRTSMDALSDASTDTASSVDVDGGKCLVSAMKYKLARMMRRFFPGPMFHHQPIEDLIQPILKNTNYFQVNQRNPHPWRNYNNPHSSSEWQIHDLMHNDGAKSFKVITADDVEIYITDVSNIKSCYARTPENGQIMKFGPTSIDFDSMAYIWLVDQADSSKLRLYLIDNTGRIETMMESNSTWMGNVNSINSRIWETLTDGFKVRENENQLQFSLDEDAVLTTYETMFWIYDSSEIYATVRTDAAVQVFAYDWNEKAWTHQASEDVYAYS